MDAYLREYLEHEVKMVNGVTLGEVKTNMETEEVIPHRLVVLVDELIDEYGDGEAVGLVLEDIMD